MFLSVAVRESHVYELLRYENDFRTATRDVRHCVLTCLRCRREGVFSLLGHTIVELAFSIATPCNHTRAVPRMLWEYVLRIRTYLAMVVLRSRENATTPYRALPSWFSISPDDVLHASLS